MNSGWVTNSPEAAKCLREIDAAYERSRKVARELPMAQKVEALRTAKGLRQAAYDALAERMRG